MFFKLLKYDMKSMSKTMIPLWITLVIIAVIMGIQIRMEDFIYRFRFLDMGGDILFLIFFALLIAIVVLNILIVIQRFWNGLLKDEGYLMFTLPVSSRKLILSKAVSAMLISLGSFLMVIICMFIFGWSILSAIEASDAGVISEFTSDLLEISVQGSDIALSILFSMAALLSSIYHVYAAMAIGHLSNRNRFLYSFAAYIVIAVIVNLIEAPLSDYILSNLAEQVWLIDSTGVSLVEVLIYHMITELILTYKLNLE